MQEHRPRCESGVKPQPPPPPPSHPGRVLLPSRVLRQPGFHVGAPPRCEAESNPNPRARPLRTWGGYRPGSCAGSGLCRSTALGAKAESNHNPRARPHSHPGRVLLPSGLLRQRRFHAGTPPTVRNGAKPQPPSPLHSHPRRVLLPSGVLRQPRFHVGAPPTVRKRSQTPTTEPTPFAPGAGAPTTN